MSGAFPIRGFEDSSFLMSDNFKRGCFKSFYFLMNRLFWQHGFTPDSEIELIDGKFVSFRP